MGMDILKAEHAGVRIDISKSRGTLTIQQRSSTRRLGLSDVENHNTYFTIWCDMCAMESVEHHRELFSLVDHVLDAHLPDDLGFNHRDHVILDTTIDQFFPLLDWIVEHTDCAILIP